MFTASTKAGCVMARSRVLSIGKPAVSPGSDGRDVLVVVERLRVGDTLSETSLSNSDDEYVSSPVSLSASSMSEDDDDESSLLEDDRDL